MMSIDGLRGLRAHVFLLFGLVLMSGCASRGPVPPAATARPEQSDRKPDETAAAKPPETLETSDAVLAMALQAATRSRSCETRVAVGDRYYELRVLDRAGSYYGAAVEAGSGCAAGHDGLARVWRDSGYLERALASAHRSTHADGTSAGAWNTLGTILQELGQLREARTAYERAARVDPTAAYAFSNLCYLAFLEADVPRGESACLKAIEADDDYVPARNNLGLLYAASGDTTRALAVFREAAGSPAAHYNLGLVWLARRDYASALKAFEAAYAEDPSFDAAHARARDVRRLLNSEKLNDDDRRVRR